MILRDRYLTRQVSFDYVNGYNNSTRGSLKFHFIPPTVYLVSDRAKALIPLAEQGVACLSLPDFLPGLPEGVKREALARGQRWRHAPQALTQAKEARARRPEPSPREPSHPTATVVVEVRQAEVTRWEAAYTPSRGLVETRSLPLPPCRLADAAPQTSAPGESQRQRTVEAIEAGAPCYPVPARPDAMTQVRTPVPALAALGDCWWQGVHQKGAPCGRSPRWRPWGDACLRPIVSEAQHVARTRCRRRKAQRQEAWEEGRAAWGHPALTQGRAPHVLAEWQAWALPRTQALPRTSAAVEGRHGSVSHMHQNHRGLPRRRDKGWTILHTFDGRA